MLDKIFSRDDQYTLSFFDLLEFTINFNEFVVERNKLIREKINLTFSTNVVETK